MPEIKSEFLAAFAAFVLPGAISMYVYGLLVPQSSALLKDKVIEAVCFSMLNVALIGLPAYELAAKWQFSIWVLWVLGLLFLVLAPALWPFLLVRVLRWVERIGVIPPQSRTAWDNVFDRLEEGHFVLVTLTDDKLVGGLFGVSSYASAYPEPGHLYVEQLWKLDNENRFVEPLPGPQGLLLRPSDYKHVKIIGGIPNG